MNAVQLSVAYLDDLHQFEQESLLVYWRHAFPAPLFAWAEVDVHQVAIEAA